ncbi:MAG TPA: 4'-phosphopantetheinyl transferase superfamily protein [Streptosporangiaceae bacterium]|nr:4'-phosphopantetheinyl transferase superfamily protein [Streptosporangiaceae bacterium]
MDGTPWGPLSLPEAGAFPAEGICHLWPTPTTNADRYQALLDQAELERADRYRVAHAKDTFIVSRAAQRLVLARYLGCPPADIKVARDCKHCGSADHGRPYIAGTTLDFSVSHSKGWLLLAVVASGKVGVDLEAVSDRAAQDLPDRIFAPAEQHQFLLVDRSQRAAHFMKIWTRKEAAVKLTGHGLAAPLSDLDVTGPTVTVSPPPPSWPQRPIHLTDLPTQADLEPTPAAISAAAPTFRAALATTVPIRAIHLSGPIPSPELNSNADPE